MEQDVICTHLVTAGERLEVLVPLVSDHHNEYHYELGHCFFFC